MAKGRIEINAGACKSCLFCIRVCPQNILKAGKALNAAGYNYVETTDPEKCMGCAMCAMICPDSVITVYR